MLMFYFMRYPPTLQRLVDVLRRLPGVGTKSAERYAFHLLTWDKPIIEEFASTLTEVPFKLERCPECGALTETACALCENPHRNAKQLCVVAGFKDVFAIESTLEYRGLYHVLGALLSPLDKRGPEKLGLPKLMERIKRLQCDEILLALDSTLEGDATALFLKKELEASGIKLSRLAFGMPMGSSLEYVDNGTLAKALISRSSF